MYVFWFALFSLDSLSQGLVCVHVLVELGTLKPPHTHPLPGSPWGERERKSLSWTYRSYYAQSCIGDRRSIAGTEVPEWGSHITPLRIEVCTPHEVGDVRLQLLLDRWATSLGEPVWLRLYFLLPSPVLPSLGDHPFYLSTATVLRPYSLPCPWSDCVLEKPGEYSSFTALTTIRFTNWTL